MNWFLVLGLLPTLLGATMSAFPGDNAAAVNATGWFSDEDCARSRINSGEVGPNGRECVQRCLKEGRKLAFIDEKAKQLFVVDNPDVAKGQESHYVQISGRTDPDKKTLHVDSVKVLKEYQAMCDRPKLKK